MIAWMLYALLVGAFLTLSALAADRMLRLHGWATRWVWIVSILGSLAVSVFWPRIPRTPAAEAPAALVPPSFTLPLDALTTSPTAPAVWPLSRILLLSWLVLSAALALYGLYAFLRLRVARAQWKSGQMDGQSVLVSDDIGPAVIGLVRPTVVVPEWVCALPARDQRLILAHENAHISARDPWLVVCSYLLPVIMPWNLVAWLQARWLRESIELDCDARLLSGSINAHGYAELLLNVGGRSARAPLAVAALSEPRSLLEKRIRRMFERRPRHRVLRASGWATLAALAVVATLRAPLPGQPLAAAVNVVEASAAQLVAAVADTTPPKLLNPAEVREAVRMNYPATQRAAGARGTTWLRVQVTDDGEVASARVSRSSGNTELDAVALKIAGVMRFAPATFQGKPVPATTEVNVEFTQSAASDWAEAVPVSRQQVESTARARASIAAAATSTTVVAQAADVPILQNTVRVAELRDNAYPNELRQSGVGGRVTIWYYVDETGTVTKTQLKSSSGIRILDDAALSFADQMQFTPAMKDGKPVGGWAEVPIDFRPNAAAVAATRPSASSAVSAQPTFTPYTIRPTLKNGEAVGKALQAYYPPLLRDAGIGGTANIWFFIDANGRVAKTQLKSSTGHAALDDAALRVAEMMEFTPAFNRDQKVSVWVDMPIVFRAGGGSEEQARRELEMAKAGAVERAAASPRGADKMFVPGSTVIAVDPMVANGTVASTKPKEVKLDAVAASVQRTTTAEGARSGGYVAVSSSPAVLANADEMGRLLQRYYPPLLRDAGVGGTATYSVIVAPDGTALKMELQQSSGHQALDQAALKVLETARFRPTGQNSPVAISIPITFKTQ